MLFPCERATALHFGLLSILVAAAVLLPAQLPMVDGPQHAAQVAGLRDLALGRCEYAEIYRVNWWTPYWLGYLPSTILAFALPVELSLRLVLLVGLLGLPLATRLLLRELGADDRFAVASFAALFGANFDWGFLPFLVAAPLALLLAWLAVIQMRRPSTRKGLGLVLLGLATFAGHALAAACGFLLAGALFLAIGQEVGRRAAAVRLAPLAIPGSVAGAWLAILGSWEPTSLAAMRWGARPWVRVSELPRLLLGIVNWPLALAAGAVLVVALVVSGATLSRDPRRWAPLGLTLAVYTLVPNHLRGTVNLYLRMLVFLVPCLLVAVAPERDSSPIRRRGGLLPSAVACVLVVAASRFPAFAAESAGLSEVLAAAPARERLLYLPLDRESSVSLAPVYLHSGARYSVDRCGVAAVSFASFYTTGLRFRAGLEPRLPTGFEWHPESLRWAAVRGQFGLFLVRSRSAVVEEDLFGARERVDLLAHQGEWSLFRTRANERLPGRSAP